MNTVNFVRQNLWVPIEKTTVDITIKNQVKTRFLLLKELNLLGHVQFSKFRG